MKVIRRLLGGVIILSTLLSLTACSPAPYPIAFTRSGDKLEVYVPTCAGWSIDSLVVDGSSPEGRGFRWQLQRINGQGTKQFILGEVPIGYKVVEKLDQDVSADYEAPEFPLDYSYEIGVSQAPFQEVPDFEGDRPRARFRTESSAFDGTDAKPGVWEDDLGFTESLDELDEYMQRNCPAS